MRTRNELTDTRTSYSNEILANTTHSLQDILPSEQLFGETRMDTMEDLCMLSFEEMVDLISTNPATITSTASQTETSLNRCDYNQGTVLVSIGTCFACQDTSAFKTTATDIQ